MLNWELGIARRAGGAPWSIPGCYPGQFQVSQTGKTVSAPALHPLGFGAIEHRAGRQTSKTIVALDKDQRHPSSKSPTTC
ncbi:hypothetical protein AWC22_01865 [Mycobacterium riyadhense]|uniref:Uncharacterized protein n=1 Tax=Mycobacterium riyadhense TaxID=486698 RepID=A0A1X2BS65_9MYCO|nr:hypothetical protein AWC22_01865 [Mycobacterium riyadhense]